MIDKRAAIAALLLLLPLHARSAEPVRGGLMLLRLPSVAGALASSRRINQEMHYAGTPGDRRLAQWMADRLRADGFRTTIESFSALVPQPGHFALQLLFPRTRNVDLRESTIPGDPDGTRPDAGIPFSGWSASGVVAAPIVYAGRGLDADYGALAAAGVDVRGRIALVRYGAEFRGLLVQRAAEHGASAVILYSDPADRDGSSHGPAYPKGAYRPLGSVQRGSVGQGTSIPVLPVSANVARSLLRTMRGTAATGAMNGGLDVPYVLGESAVRARLVVEEPFERRTLWNTIGVLAGSDPSEEIVFGGHRDAWVYGVTDNGDGISTLLETARALGALARSGWRPRRSIVIAGWDGEELGELGSIVYVREHADHLRAGCVAYVNMDEGESGAFFGAAAAAALAALPASVAESVPDPTRPSRTLLARWQAQADGARIESPGGGSDFEAFLYDVGIPIVDMGFSGPFGVYHSSFDDLRYAMTQADPGFVNHRAMAQMLGLAAYRLADERLATLYRFSAYAETMREALAKIVPAKHAADVASFAAALDRFAQRAALVGGRLPTGLALDAVHRLDLLCYGRNGYASIPLPLLSAAIESDDANAIRRASRRSAAELDAIANELGAR